MIGERLKEERERLQMTQPDFAAAAGAAKRTLIEWEKGSTSPSAVQLSALSEIGVDVLYVITGQRREVAAHLPPREAALLEKYRAAPPKVQDATQTLLDAATQCDKRKAG